MFLKALARVMGGRKSDPPPAHDAASQPQEPRPTSGDITTTPGIPDWQEVLTGPIERQSEAPSPDAVRHAFDLQQQGFWAPHSARAAEIAELVARLRAGIARLLHTAPGLVEAALSRHPAAFAQIRRAERRALMIPDHGAAGPVQMEMLLASLDHEARTEDHRRWLMWQHVLIFGLMFLVLVVGETLFGTILFSILEIEILGSSVSGAAFALMIPTVMLMAHVKMHAEGDHFSKWWLSRLSTIGIPIFCLGLSLSLGFAAWQAAEDAVGALTSAPRGTLGSRSITAEAPVSSGITEALSALPNALLFLGLSLGMIISIALASYFLGRALVAYNILTVTPRIGPEVRAQVAELQGLSTTLHRLEIKDRTALAQLPLDPKLHFARAAAHVCRQACLRQLDAAHRKFAAGRANDPMAGAFADPEAEAIPSRFTSEATYIRHMAGVQDSLRVYNLLAQLGGIPSKED